MSHVKIQRISKNMVLINDKMVFIDSTGGYATDAPTNYICMEREPLTKNLVRGKNLQPSFLSHSE